MMMTLVGIGYRASLVEWVGSGPPEIECLELTAEHFFDQSDEAIVAVAADRPVFVHGLGLSLATPGPLDSETLQSFQRVVELSRPKWISEHLAFTRTAEVDLGHLNPVPPTHEMLERISDNAIALSEACNKPLILENITSHVMVAGEMDEPSFLNQLCSRAGCGLLVDVTNLYINSKNHGFDPLEWLHQLNPKTIVQLHIVGYSYRDGRWHDSHHEPIQKDLFELCQAVVEYAPVKAIIIERDGNFPDPQQLAGELRTIKAFCNGD
ncbi:MAG: DUF692 domain-containing protein [Fuerstiella sp.]